MLETLIRDIYQKVLVDRVALIANRFSRLTPNKITFLSGVFGVLVIPLLYVGHSWLALASLLFSGYLDTLDGTVARLSQTDTSMGSMLDIMTDRVVESSVIIALYLVEPVQRAGLCLFMIISILLCVSSFLLVGIFSQNQTEKSFYYSPGLVERAEAFVLFSGMILFPSWFVVFAIIFVVTVLWTAGHRIFQFVKQERQE